MYDKVIVMEIKEAYILAMKEDGQIIRIKKKSGLAVGDTIYVLEEDLYIKEPGMVIPIEKKKNSWKKIVAVAAAFLLIFTSVALYGNMGTAYAMISVDSERNVQVVIDKKGTIKKVTSVNKTIPEQELKKIKGQNVRNMLDGWAEESSKEKNLIVGFASIKNISKEDADKIIELLNEILGEENVCYMHGNKLDIKEAKKQKKSLGIYLIKKGLEEDRVDEILENMEKDKFLESIVDHPAIVKEKEVNSKIKEKLNNKKHELDQEDDDKDDDDEDDNDRDDDENDDDVDDDDTDEGDDDDEEDEMDKKDIEDQDDDEKENIKDKNHDDDDDEEDFEVEEDDEEDEEDEEDQDDDFDEDDEKDDDD